jgi:N-acetylneuraminic acid mutarotase
VLVWGPFLAEAYNPATNRWRTLPPSPIGRVGGIVVWTGHQLIGWGGGCCGDAFSDGAAYDPATNRWQKLPPSPLAGSQNPLGAWTGRELVIFVGAFNPDGKPLPRRLARAAAYNPATRRWREIAPIPSPRGGARAVWDGREVLVVGGALTPLAYGPATNRWRSLPRMDAARTGFAAVWTGTRLLLWGGTAGSPAAPSIPAHGLAYDAKANRWTPLPPAPILGRSDPTGVWTGRSLLVWGGGTAVPAFADGAAFTPAR